MSESPATLENLDPRYNPTYPLRTHTFDRQGLLTLMQKYEERVKSAQTTLESLPEGAKRDQASYLFAQMLGARDQIAETILRLPTEVGHNHHQDTQRLEEAEKSFERISSKWKTMLG